MLALLHSLNKILLIKKIKLHAVTVQNCKLESENWVFS